jgi:glycosyltransferase involved in cell wall biosynthesis
MPVSQFTAEEIQKNLGIDASNCRVLNNCLDPFLSIGKKYKNKEEWRDRFGYKLTDKILFTLTRLSSKERYKGYDKVIESVAHLKQQYPEIIYLIGGSCDEAEKSYLKDLIKKFDVEKNVILIGFVKDSELAIYFSIADLYVMPSMKEGFGIVFIEAMFYGLPVIAGNRDGSVDALSNGELGLLVDPLDKRSITTAIEKIISNKDAYIPDRSLLMDKFSYQTYKKNLDQLLF